MRNGCYKCCIKHLAQAGILLEESRYGHPLHEYLAWGHLAEAASEIESLDAEIAEKIRSNRKMLQDIGKTYPLMYLDLIEEVAQHVQV